MMTVLMDSSSAPSSWELAQRLYKKNIELENGLRKSAQSKVPSDPNAWRQMCENYEAIILEDHDFSEKHEVEYLLWQLHYRRIEEFRNHINAAGSVTSQGGKSPARSDRIKKIRSVFKSFLSEATGFYHDLILKVRAKYGLPLGYFSEGSESRSIQAKDEKKSAEMKKGLMSCHRCLIYLGDLARYKGLYGEGDSVSRDYAAASSYYLQASSLCPSSGNPQHQLAILASYSGDELVAVYRYFRSLAVDNPFSTARDNLIIAFEKNRQSYSQLPSNAKVTSARTLPSRSTGRGRDRGDARLQAKDSKTESSPIKEHNLYVAEIFKTFCTRFVRFNGIMFTRTSLETFEEIFSLIISDLHELLSSGPEEELNFGQDAAENALVLVRLIAILIFTVHNVNRDPEGQLYAEILQRTVLLQNASTAAFEFAGHILKRCIKLHDAASSYLLPAILVFIEWLACHRDIAAGSNVQEKQAHARSLFWNQFVYFLNKLMLSGLVSSDGNEDENCFSDMGRYDDDKTDKRMALWEDFELRGFLPLVPAQVILDFSRKHSFGSEGCMMEKRARVQRILAAGRALTDVVQVDQQGMYFDPNLNKFVIGAKPPSYEDRMYTGMPHAPELNASKCGNLVERAVDRMYTGMPHAPELNASKCGNLVERAVDLEVSESRTVKLEMTPSMIPTPLRAGGEEEEEEIVFKPVLSEKYVNLNAAKAAAYEMIQPVQISSKGDWATYGAPHSTSLNNTHMSTVVSASSQLHTPVTTIIQQSFQPVSSNTSKWLIEQEAILSDGLNNLNVIENGLLVEHGLQEGLSRFQPTAFSPLVSAPANLNTSGMYSEMKVAEPVIPSKHDSIVPSGATSDGSTMNLSAALPVASRKNPVSRPVRHLGPPPGFSHVPSKQLDDKNSNSVVRDQLLQIDDYSWLDGYQPVSTKGMGMSSTNHTAVRVSSSTSSTFSGAMTFPFPGKQISTVQTRVADEKLQDFQTFEHLKPFSDQQLHQTNLQASLLPEQHQAQPLWPSRFFV